MKRKILITAMCLMVTLSAAGCGASGGKNTVQETSQETSSDTSVISSGSDGAEAALSVSSSSESLTDQILAAPVRDGDFKIADAITLGNYKKLDLTKEIQTVTDHDITSYIESQMTPEEVTDKNAAAALGDTVDIAYEGKIDGKAFDGGSSDSYDLTLGSGSFIEGFEDGVVGMKKGETKDLKLRFPDNYYSSDLAGKDVVFTVTVNAIKRTPELTDDWVKNYTNNSISDVADYRESVRKSLTQQEEEKAESELQGEAWNQVQQASVYHFLPKEYVKNGEESFEANIKSEAEKYGLSLDEYIEQSGIDQDTYSKQKEQNGRYAAASKLLLGALVKAEKLSENSPAYQKELQKAADLYGVSSDDLISKNGKDNVYNYVMTNVVLDRIIGYARVKEKKVSSAENTDQDLTGDFYG